jgi:hypothetical protein
VASAFRAAASFIGVRPVVMMAPSMRAVAAALGVLLTSCNASSTGGSADGGPKGGIGGGAADFQKYMDYSKYMGISSQYTDKDWMSQWQKYQQEGQAGQGAQTPYSATDCKTEEELKAWHDKQVSTTKEWIPKQFQGPTLDSIEKDYKTNMDRIKNGPANSTDAALLVDDSTVQGIPISAAAVPAYGGQPGQPGQPGQAAEPEYLSSADKCQTKAQLDAWHLKQQTQLDKYVPKAYQSYSLAPIEAEYAKQLKRIEGQAMAKANSATTTASDKAKLALKPADIFGAQRAPSVEALVAWRADLGAKVDQLPAQERPEWEKMLNQQLEAGLVRLQAAESAAVPKGPSTNAAATTLTEAAPNAKSTSRWSRTLLVCLLAFALPVAAVHVFSSIKQASMSGTNYDEQFIPLDAGA